MIWYTYTLSKYYHFKVRHILHITELPFCVCVVRTFEIYSFSKCQVYNTALLTAVTMLYVRASELIHHIIHARLYFSLPNFSTFKALKTFLFHNFVSGSFDDISCFQPLYTVTWHSQLLHSPGPAKTLVTGKLASDMPYKFSNRYPAIMHNCIIYYVYYHTILHYIIIICLYLCRM